MLFDSKKNNAPKLGASRVNRDHNFQIFFPINFSIPRNPGRKPGLHDKLRVDERKWINWENERQRLLDFVNVVTILGVSLSRLVPTAVLWLDRSNIHAHGATWKRRVCNLSQFYELDVQDFRKANTRSVGHRYRPKSSTISILFTSSRKKNAKQ